MRNTDIKSKKPEGFTIIGSIRLQSGPLYPWNIRKDDLAAMGASPD